MWIECEECGTEFEEMDVLPCVECGLPVCPNCGFDEHDCDEDEWA